MMLALLAQQPASVSSAQLVDDLTMDQLLRLAALPPARLAEARCAGFARWQVQNEAPRALSGATVDELVDSVGSAVAHDAELGPAQGRAMVEEFAAEFAADLAPLGPAERAQAVAKEETACSALLADARDSRLSLHPLANRAIVDPALASCYGQYQAAAARASGQEAVNLKRDADAAAELALAGKDGKARDAAMAALSAEAASAAASRPGGPESEMMRLVMCQPRIYPRPAAKDSR